MTFHKIKRHLRNSFSFGVYIYNDCIGTLTQGLSLEINITKTKDLPEALSPQTTQVSTPNVWPLRGGDLVVSAEPTMLIGEVDES